MKTKYVLTSLVVFLLMFQSAEAQFLKKLKKRVEQKVENVVIEKTADKAAEKTNQSMDKIFEGGLLGGLGGGKKGDPSLVADTYDFTWKYSLQMTTKEGEIVFDYYLKPEAPYFGFTSEKMSDIFNVMDTDKNIIAMFMKSDGNSIGMVTQMPSPIDLEEVSEASGDYTYETLPDKVVNGYQCKGVKATGKDYIMVMYFTNETEVSFDDLFKSSTTKIPPALKDYFNPDDKVLMISMGMTDLKNKKNNATMECIGLEEVQKTILKSDYKFM